MISKTSRAVLASATLRYRRIFARLRSVPEVYGHYEDDWTYRGKRLRFVTVEVEDYGGERTLLGVEADEIARCYITHLLSRGSSPDLVYSRLRSFRVLAAYVATHDIDWDDIKGADLDRTIDGEKERVSHASVYSLAGGLTSFVKWLNALRTRVSGIEVRFNKRYLKWRHRVTNPIRSSAEELASAKTPKTKSKYDPNLHRAIAEARLKVIEDPNLEPNPGYDRIRLEALAFGLSVGIRVGAICRLSVNALERDDSTGHSFVRVPTQKNEDPRVTAVPALWDDALWNAYGYLLEQCSAARERAREIEKSGFDFIARELRKYRSENPLGINRESQLSLAGLDPNWHFFIGEITSTFDVSLKEFNGKHQSCRRILPRPVASALVMWIDERMRNWDWHTIEWRSRRKALSIDDIALAVGVPKAPVVKGQFANDLRAWLRILGPMDCDLLGTASGRHRQKAKRSWESLRATMCEARPGAHCIVIDVRELGAILERRHLKELEKHFKTHLRDRDGNPVSLSEPQQTKPGAAQRLSDHLIVVWENQFTAYNKPGFLPMPLKRSNVYDILSECGHHRTVFERLGVLDDNAKPYSFPVHAIRRWVTTSMLRSGPSHEAVDLWMGRKLGGSRVYDYRTATERAEKLRQLYLGSSRPPQDFLGKKVIEWRERGMDDREIHILIDQKLRAVHFTPWGACSRELYISPCQKGLVCLRGFGEKAMCSSFHINPEDQEARAQIEGLLSQYSGMLSILEPKMAALSEYLLAERNPTLPLDQHLQFMIDVVEGCKAALQVYSNHNP